MIVKCHFNVPVAQYSAMKTLMADYEAFLNRVDLDKRGGFSKAEENKAERLGDMVAFETLEDPDRFRQFTVGDVTYQRIITKLEVNGKNNFLKIWEKLQEDWPGIGPARIKDMYAGVQAGYRIVKQETDSDRVRTQKVTAGGADKIKTRDRTDRLTVVRGNLWLSGEHFSKANPRKNEDIQQTDDDGNVTGTVSEQIVKEFGLEAGEPPDYDLEDAKHQVIEE